MQEHNIDDKKVTKQLTPAEKMMKERFAQAEEIFRQGGGRKTTDIINNVWLKLYENEKYYFHSFRNKLLKQGGISNAQQVAENEFFDCFCDVIIETTHHYDPERGQLENYFNYIWAKRAQDQITKIDTRMKNEQSLEAGTEDGNNDMENQISKPKNGDRQTDVSGGIEGKKIREELLAEVYVELLNAITHMEEHTSAKTSRKTYFKMFFTDHITEYCKNFEITRSIKDREKSIFSGMELNFLDFYMRAICRTFKAIQRVPLKSMKEITGKGTDEEIKIPLQDKIYLVYLGLSSAGGITQKKKQYRDFCENLEIKDKLKNSTV